MGLVIGVDLTIVVDKVEAIDIINEAVVVIVNAFLTIEFRPIDIEVVLEVRVLDVNTAIIDRNDDI